jgi:hypothetical protein
MFLHGCELVHDGLYHYIISNFVLNGHWDIVCFVVAAVVWFVCLILKPMSDKNVRTENQHF